MSTPEAIFTLIWSLVQLFCSIGCTLGALTLWCFIVRNRWIEREIRKLYKEENGMGEPVYQILQIADLLGLDWEVWDIDEHI